MTDLESALTSRNAALRDMVALLQRQHDAKLDVVAPARDLLSAYDLRCRSAYDLTCRSRRGNHGTGLLFGASDTRSLSR